jgi:hypothetical protein
LDDEKGAAYQTHRERERNLVARHREEGGKEKKQHQGAGAPTCLPGIGIEWQFVRGVRSGGTEGVGASKD